MPEFNTICVPEAFISKAELRFVAGIYKTKLFSDGVDVNTQYTDCPRNTIVFTSCAEHVYLMTVTYSFAKPASVDSTQTPIPDVEMQWELDLNGATPRLTLLSISGGNEDTNSYTEAVNLSFFGGNGNQ